ncbi:MAG: type II toxin-antitoxin system RelE/ParE family toxin [Candidatus Thiodiazotropha taylori]|nr:type II toxin-antitoxin system RelE/ParE family toxin [Candidatus Thiodiazotropha taylori]MCG8120674.1 type II toxin-antitoxin system RelE/ParE family toxin [Candidatus Thiodiazotropha taylori]MCW4296365.1 type II toxin-antitoxin system RelE/ParE family toxin [Candidatus Thiodiazotropha endolucinida]MCW4306798.1 type II toxin-antitoxin system RelE/ParE family toxin [Candidatus Thiodiazotropha endolucinida]
MHTVVELPTYTNRAKGLLSDAEQKAIISYLADNPSAGELIRETGGVRKLRWKRGASGKSGGVRVIYFYHSVKIPLFLLAMYSKSDQGNLTREQRNSMKKAVTALVKTWEDKQ